MADCVLYTCGESLGDTKATMFLLLWRLGDTVGCNKTLLKGLDYDSDASFVHA